MCVKSDWGRQRGRSLSLVAAAATADYPWMISNHCPNMTSLTGWPNTTWSPRCCWRSDQTNHDILCSQPEEDTTLVCKQHPFAFLLSFAVLTVLVEHEFDWKVLSNSIFSAIQFSVQGLVFRFKKTTIKVNLCSFQATT